MPPKYQRHSVRRCIVSNCNNTSSNAILFRLPKDEQRCSTWIKNCNRMDLAKFSSEHLYGCYRVCGSHFEENMFAGSFSTLFANKLKQNAIPTIFSGPENIQDPTESNQTEYLPRTFDCHEIRTREEQEVVTLSEICRVCLMKTDNMKHLLEPNEEVIQIVRKLSSISNIEIELNGTLPSFLCAGCEEKLNSAYDFQQLCQKSHNFMLACVSASSVTFKVNSFKPIEFEDNPENQIQLQPENDPNSFVNLVDNNGFEKKVNVDYCPLPEFADCNQNDENNIPIQNEVNVQETDTENCSMDNKLEIIKIEDDGTHEIPSISCEVEKRTKYNQTMRLPQYSPEEVNKVIQKTKERFFKRVNCLHCGFMAKDSRSLSVHMTRLHKDKKEQWCLWCNTNFENIQEHLSTLHKDDLKCPFCGKCKSKMGHFMEHLASHSIERKHICRECRKCFISERHLKNHCNQVHSTKKPFQCRYCPKAFSCPKSLNNHLRFHNKRGCKSRTDRLPSEDADNQKGSESEENESEKTCNNFCKICNKRVRSLPRHTKAFHSDGEKTENKDPLHILCSYCGKRFKSMAKLTIHIRTHTGELPYKCSFCDKRMRTRIHLVVHERVHTGEKPHVCKFCGKAFAQSSVLNTHMKQHTGRTEECPTCQKRFCRPSELRLHMRTHTGEKPYECNICGQSFVQKSHLVGHSRKHSENRPYKCEFCSKAFKQPSSHRKHTNSHLKIFPYKCYICTFTTRQKSSLQEHMLQHQKDPLSESMHKCDICDQYFMNFEIYSMHYTNEHGSPEEQCIMKDDFVGTSTTEVYIME